MSSHHKPTESRLNTSSSLNGCGDSVTKDNVDPAELDKFERIAATWWDLDGQFKPLHQLNPVRVNFIKNGANSLFDKDILDVGCGGGILTESLAKEKANVTGLDLGKAPLTVAKAHAKQNHLIINYINQSVESLAAEQPESFDVITCMEMLEHVPDPAAVIRACATLVKPGGDVFFSTLNRNPKSLMLAVIAAEYVLNLVPRGTHEFKKFIKPSEIMAMIDKTPLITQSIKGIYFNPLTQSFRISNDVSVNYMIHAKKQ